MYKVLALFSFIILLAHSATLHAEQSDTEQGEASAEIKLSELNQAIQLNNDRLEDILTVKTKLESELKTLNSNLSLLRREDANLKEKLDKLFKEWQATNERIAQIDDRIDLLKVRSLKRIRSLYIAQNNNSGGYLLKISASDTLPTLSYLLGKIEQYDRNLVSELSELYKEQQLEEERYERTIREQKAVKAKIVSKAEELNEKIKKKNSVARMLHGKQEELEKLVTHLRVQALRLETVVASITGDSEQSLLASEENRREIKEVAGERALSKSNKEFAGNGLKAGDVNLVKPVQGKVIRTFGKAKHHEFKDFVFNKGVLFAAPSGTVASAVAKGRVLFSGRLPGYENLVILDHGKRIYTLYARLEASQVRVGQIVQGGEEIGKITQPGNDIGNFYFEIRENGKPINPMRYFKSL